MTVFQSGAWLLPDEKPLAPDLEHFLNAGDPPVYFGFGSNRVPVDLTAAIIEAARQLGKRVVVSRGWADLSLVDDGLDCISISEANLHILFKRVAAVVHHGGAGTTTAAARAGVPQLVMPQHYDQHYWARRAETLGIGIAYATQGVSSHGLVEELERVLEPSVAGRAASIADCIRIDGAAVAADRVIRDYSRREDSIDTKSTRTSPK
jgi:vancomycin aglycone glucosyltransferase